MISPFTDQALSCHTPLWFYSHSTHFRERNNFWTFAELPSTVSYKHVWEVHKMADNCKRCLLEWPWSSHYCLVAHSAAGCIYFLPLVTSLIANSQQKMVLPSLAALSPAQKAASSSPSEPSCLFQNKLKRKALKSWNVHWVKAQSWVKWQCHVFSEPL